MVFSFVAESTGHQVSSRLLSMKSANALLVLPATGSVIPAGTLVPAIAISNLSVSTPSKSSLLPDSVSVVQVTSSHDTVANGHQEAAYRVAILTVSDTVASRAGPDRRYHFNDFTCWGRMLPYCSFYCLPIAEHAGNCLCYPSGSCSSFYRFLSNILF